MELIKDYGEKGMKKRYKTIIIISILVLLNFINCYKIHCNSYRKYYKKILGNHITGTLFDPFILYDNNKYKMFVSKRNEDSIVLFESDNGLNWDNNKYITVLTGDEDWEKIVNRATVLKHENKYYMYYTGQDVKNQSSCIGLAISDDGYNYTKIKKQPILLPEYDFEGKNLMNPQVIFDKINNIYKMWYNAGEFTEPDLICYATSTDGINWNKYEKPVFEKNADINSLDNYKVALSQIIKYENKYLMLYIGYSDLDTGRTFIATSNDGINFNRTNNLPIICPTKDNFDASSVYHTGIVYNEKYKEWFIYYNGRNGIDEYIGLVRRKKAELL